MHVDKDSLHQVFLYETLMLWKFGQEVAMVPRSRGKKEAQAMWEPGGKKHEKTIKLSSQKKTQGILL